MAHVPTPNGVKVCMRYDLEGQIVCNIFHVDNGGPPDSADLLTIAAAFGDWYESYLKAQQTPALVLQAIEAVDISTDGGAGIEYIPTGGVVGTNTGARLANSITVAVKLLTGFTGRSKRGRSYFNGLTAANLIDPNHLSPASAAVIRQIYDHLITTLQGIGKPLAVLSTISNGVPRVAGLLTPILSAAVDLIVDNQRRRLPGRGA